MDQAASIRARVLDAAAQCLLAGGFGSGRLHSAIARTAGLSRPTLYKYVGDQDAIISALVQRELATFLAELRPVLDAELPPGEQIQNVLVVAVCRAREHQLLQAALRQIPERLLPWFTTHADVLLEQAEPVLTPHIQRYLDQTRQAQSQAPVLIDALCRIALSLVFTNGLLDLADPDRLRAYLAAVLGAIHPLATPTR